MPTGRPVAAGAITVLLALLLVGGAAPAWARSAPSTMLSGQASQSGLPREACDRADDVRASDEFARDGSRRAESLLCASRPAPPSPTMAFAPSSASAVSTVVWSSSRITRGERADVYLNGDGSSSPIEAWTGCVEIHRDGTRTLQREYVSEVLDPGTFSITYNEVIVDPLVSSSSTYLIEIWEGTTCAEAVEGAELSATLALEPPGVIESIEFTPSEATLGAVSSFVVNGDTATRLRGWVGCYEVLIVRAGVEHLLQATDATADAPMEVASFDVGDIRSLVRLGFRDGEALIVQYSPEVTCASTDRDTVFRAALTFRLDPDLDLASRLVASTLVLRDSDDVAMVTVDGLGGAFVVASWPTMDGRDCNLSFLGWSYAELPIDQAMLSALGTTSITFSLFDLSYLDILLGDHSVPSCEGLLSSCDRFLESVTIRYEPVGESGEAPPAAAHDCATAASDDAEPPRTELAETGGRAPEVLWAGLLALALGLVLVLVRRPRTL